MKNSSKHIWFGIIAVFGILLTLAGIATVLSHTMTGTRIGTITDVRPYEVDIDFETFWRGPSPMLGRWKTKEVPPEGTVICVTFWGLPQHPQIKELCPLPPTSPHQ